MADYSNFGIAAVYIITPICGKAAKKPYILSYTWEKYPLFRQFLEYTTQV